MCLTSVENYNIQNSFVEVVRNEETKREVVPAASSNECKSYISREEETTFLFVFFHILLSMLLWRLKDRKIYSDGNFRQLDTLCDTFINVWEMYIVT